MWMTKLLTAMNSPKWRGVKVTHVQCVNCRTTVPVADARVDRDGFLWCPPCARS